MSGCTCVQRAVAGCSSPALCQNRNRTQSLKETCLPCRSRRAALSAPGVGARAGAWARAAMHARWGQGERCLLGDPGWCSGLRQRPHTLLHGRENRAPAEKMPCPPYDTSRKQPGVSRPGTAHAGPGEPCPLSLPLPCAEPGVPGERVREAEPAGGRGADGASHVALAFPACDILPETHTSSERIP